MTGHGALTVNREGPGQFVLWCECLEPVRGRNVLELHRAHQEHIVAEELAERRGLDLVAP
jgi:hypothetical protein